MSGWQSAISFEALPKSLAVEVLTKRAFEAIAVLEANSNHRAVGVGCKRSDVDDIEPRGGDPRDEDVLYVGPVESVEQRRDGVGGVGATDGAGTENEVVDDAVGADDSTRERAGLGPVRLRDTKSPDPGFHAYVFSLMSFSRSSNSSFEAVNSNSTSPS